MAVGVVTDSSCDLPADVVASLGIEIVPLVIRYGDDELRDRTELSAADFWTRYEAQPVMPSTASPPPGAFEEAYGRVAEQGGDGVVCITLSGALSGTANSAETAASSVRSDLAVEVVDSRTVSLGLGLIAMAAAERAAAGAALPDVAAVARHAAERSRLWGVLDTLDHLRAGGRIGGAQALLASVLAIKPIIEVRDGRVEAAGRQRTRSRALRHLVEEVSALGALERVGVMHSRVPEASALARELQSLVSAPVVLADIGAVIGTHVGPGSVGVAALVA